MGSARAAASPGGTRVRPFRAGSGLADEVEELVPLTIRKTRGSHQPDGLGLARSYPESSYVSSDPTADMNLCRRSVTSSAMIAISATSPSGPRTGAFTPLQ